jgi:phage terminase small subunit
LPVLVVLARRGSPPDPTPTIGPSLPLPYVANVCFRGMLPLLHMDLEKVDRDVAHVTFFCKCFQWYIASILKKY